MSVSTPPTGTVRGGVRAAGVLAALAVAAAVVGPFLALHPPSRQHADFVYAPPMPVRLVDADGRLRPPFVYPIVLVDRIERRFDEDRARPVPLFDAVSGGGAPGAVPGAMVPWFPLGTDGLGRDVWSRLAAGTRTSLGVAAVACAGALAIGLLIGAISGLARRLVDEGFMRVAEFVAVLPALYVVLALRATLPLVLPPAVIFGVIATVLALVGWPTVARGVRAIVRREAAADHVAAARAIGCGPVRVVAVHVLPATVPFLVTQALLLVPAFVIAEATLSYVGLGFNPPAASWGVMLQEAANVAAIADFPWVLAPAGAIVVVTLVMNAVAGER